MDVRKATMALSNILGSPIRSHFPFPSSGININNGSFGSCPYTISESMHNYQRQIDAQPDIYLRYRVPGQIDKSRAAVAGLINADVDNVVLIPNATTGVHTVLWNLQYEPGDKIVYLSTTYGACEKVIDYVTEKVTGVEAVRVDIQYPMSKAEILEKFEYAISLQGVRVALFDTVSSMPAFRLPFEEMVLLCKKYNILSLIDGAHGVGCIPLDLRQLDADFFVSNLHKWLFTPRSCALLHVPARNQHLIRSSLPTSHGYMPIDKPGKAKINNPLPASDKSYFVQSFEFVGTLDYSPFLCVSDAIKYRDLVCGGEEEIIKYCITLAQRGSERVAEILETEVIGEAEQRECPMGMVRLPIDISRNDIAEGKGRSIGAWIEKVSAEEYDAFVPVILHSESLWVRLSGQVYLTLEDFDRVGKMLSGICKRAATDMC
ncbi:putative cysteine desulfurylase [Talaromyces proteolyticus]|uniref:Cysteine desulfurylase n=1 Tax=Talaromyces proteolyticus TaxID=1131652 RepID=A0AAD4PZW0_9EURO|nr:putative cysteine desulfurylase [Talaromyces proteolyticus]KAH8703428.1 putative cysteine desulfurylase [Talaromyces proteolyticus]